jgi:hypothetical protein
MTLKLARASSKNDLKSGGMDVENVRDAGRSGQLS